MAEHLRWREGHLVCRGCSRGSHRIGGLPRRDVCEDPPRGWDRNRDSGWMAWGRPRAHADGADSEMDASPRLQESRTGRLRNKRESTSLVRIPRLRERGSQRTPCAHPRRLRRRNPDGFVVARLRPSTLGHQPYPSLTDTTTGESPNGAQIQESREEQEGTHEKAKERGSDRTHPTRDANRHAVPRDQRGRKSDRVLQEGVRREGSQPPRDAGRHPDACDDSDRRLLRDDVGRVPGWRYEVARLGRWDDLQPARLLEGRRQTLESGRRGGCESNRCALRPALGRAVSPNSRF